MDAVDWLNIAPEALSNSIAFFMGFISLVSAYLVVAYVVGKELLPSQVIVINLLFSVSTILTIFGNAVTARNAIQAHYLGSLNVEEMIALPEFLIYFVPISLILIDFCIVLASLKFMWDIRHPKTG